MAYARAQALFFGSIRLRGLRECCIMEAVKYHAMRTQVAVKHGQSQCLSHEREPVNRFVGNAAQNRHSPLYRRRRRGVRESLEEQTMTSPSGREFLTSTRPSCGLPSA